MSLYVQIDSEDERFVKKTILEATAEAVACQSTALKLAKLKKSKSGAMIGASMASREIEKEVEKIKMALPDVKEKQESPKTVSKPQLKTSRAKHEAELEAIRERLAKLSQPMKQITEGMLPALISEDVLAKAWNTPEEDEAWKDL